MKLDIMTAVARVRAGKRSAALVTDLDGGSQALLMFDGDWTGELTLEPAAIDAARRLWFADRSGVVETGGKRLFIQAFNPPPRFFIVGAVHIAQPLAVMATLAGYTVTVIDPRRSFATDERFPGIAVIAEWPDEALGRLRPDRRSVIVTLTHDPKLDDAALEVALMSEAFYIGSLGSKKTHASRRARLAERGFDEGALARINGPIGLAIGATSPAEIAISIMAQIVAVKRQGDREGAEVAA